MNIRNNMLLKLCLGAMLVASMAALLMTNVADGSLGGTPTTHAAEAVPFATCPTNGTPCAAATATVNIGVTPGPLSANSVGGIAYDPSSLAATGFPTSVDFTTTTTVTNATGLIAPAAGSGWRLSMTATDLTLSDGSTAPLFTAPASSVAISCARTLSCTLFTNAVSPDNQPLGAGLQVVSTGSTSGLGSFLVRVFGTFDYPGTGVTVSGGGVVTTSISSGP